MEAVGQDMAADTHDTDLSIDRCLQLSCNVACANKICYFDVFVFDLLVEICIAKLNLLWRTGNDGRIKVVIDIDNEHDPNNQNEPLVEVI